MNIYLIGYRCTGKTSVGKRLSEILSRPFVDADKYLESSVGMTVAEFVNRFGWPAFRKKEGEMLEELGKEDNLIVATGGGVILDPENIRILKQTGTVFWLDASEKTLLNRMIRDPETQTLRPALTKKSLAEEVADTMSERRPLYECAHHFRVGTEDRDVDAVSQQIVQEIGGIDAG